jgi:ABC-type multidrug transport system, ATPase component
MNAIDVNNISKSYANLKALNNISFCVNQGELFGLIGSDGAGKSTMFRILTTLLLPDSGSARVEGFDTVKDYKQIRSCIGYMPGKFSLYPDLTVRENIELFASVFNTTPETNRSLINDIYIQIEPFNSRRAAKLSGGMKQKLALCCALIHAPKVLFLDEPTTGVDPVSRSEFWQMLHHLKEKGITIMASTPYMDEARQCERIAFISNGEILQTASPKEIVSSFGEVLYSATSNNMHSMLKDIRSFKGVKSAYAFGQSHHFTITNKSFEMKALLLLLENKGYKDITIQAIEPTIEDCYMKIAQ